MYSIGARRCVITPAMNRIGIARMAVQSMIPVSSAVKILVKSITIGLAPSLAKILVSMPGGEMSPTIWKAGFLPV